MAAVLGAGLIFAWVRAQGSFLYASIVAVHSLGFWAVVFAGSFGLSRAFGPAIRGRVTRGALPAFAGALMVVTAYLAWAMYRSIYEVDWLNRGFPYPDPAILALEGWYDARHPIRTPGSIKMHGEFPRVRFALGLATLALIALDGLLLGLLAIPRRDATEIEDGRPSS